MVSLSVMLEKEVCDDLDDVAIVVKPRRENNPSRSEQVRSLIEDARNNPLRKLDLLMYDLKCYYRDIYGSKGLNLLTDFLKTFHDQYEESDQREVIFFRSIKKLSAGLKQSKTKGKSGLKVKDLPKCVECRDKEPNPTGAYYECKECFDVLCAHCSVSHIRADTKHHVEKYQIPA